MIFAERLIVSIESGHLPAAGGLEDQSEQYRRARTIVLAAKGEILKTLQKEEKPKGRGG